MGGESRAATMADANHRKTGPAEAAVVGIAEGEEAVLAVAWQEAATEVQWVVRGVVAVGEVEPWELPWEPPWEPR